jgi:S1-C subfamily serine protease
MRKEVKGIPYKQLVIYAVFLAAGGLAGWASGFFLNNDNRFTRTPQSPSIESSSPAAPELSIPNLDLGQRANTSNFIAEAVERVGPAVVRIDAARTIPNQFQDLQNPFRRFFEDGSPIPPEERLQQGTGSGFLLNEDGYIVTNAHVVEGADIVTVTLKDGREFDGQVRGIDIVTDIAAIKIDATGLPKVTLGSSTNLIPGQWAIAIGNPLGLDNTVTAGIISATGRSSNQVGIPDRRVRFIQTDAAINPGNSGGPLINDQGEVIGINTAIRADAQGLGFAIPIETAQRVVEQLFATGRVQHPYLGIQMVELTPSVRERLNSDPEANFNISVDQGVLILDVLPDSPAAVAALQPGDVILRIDGRDVETALEVQEQVENSQIGQPIAVEINRGGQNQSIQVRPSAMPTKAVR